MSSVTTRINQVQQPRGGYLNPKDFKAAQLETLCLDAFVQIYVNV